MKERKLVKVAYAQETTQAGQIVNYLWENGIAAYSRGGVMDVYTANNGNGQDILVAVEDQEGAQALLKEYHPISTGSIHRPTSKGQRVRNGILLGIMVLVLGFCLVLIIGFGCPF